MPIVNTKVSQNKPQADGRIWTTERHVDHTGSEHRVEYLARAEWDHEAVAALRAANLGAEIDRREEQIAESFKFVVSWTKREFMERFTPQERIAIRAAAKDNALLSDFLEILNMSQDVTPGFGTLMSGLYYLEMLGILAEGRADEIGGI